MIVSAPTGAGKTLVAEFAISVAALERGVRIAYTTPLKALSNQKFGDFSRAYGDGSGRHPDRRRQGEPPRAASLVMTTEILRNTFYGSGLDDLGYVVLDECHYMGDEGRGTVWEEIIVNAPKDVDAGRRCRPRWPTSSEIADWISTGAPAHRGHRRIPSARSRCTTRWPTSPAEIHEMDDVRRGRAPAWCGDEPRGPDDPAALVHAACGRTRPC